MRETKTIKAGLSSQPEREIVRAEIGDTVALYFNRGVFEVTAIRRGESFEQDQVSVARPGRIVSTVVSGFAVREIVA